MNGAYRIKAKLPSDRTGRHLLYTIWQNTSTPDTYYSCSDVVFPAAKENTGAGEGGSASKKPAATPTNAAPTKAAPTPTPSASPADVTSAPVEPSVAVTDAAGEAVSSPDSGDDNQALALPLVAGGAAGLLITAGAAFTLRRRR